MIVENRASLYSVVYTVIGISIGSSELIGFFKRLEPRFTIFVIAAHKLPIPLFCAEHNAKLPAIPQVLSHQPRISRNEKRLNRLLGLCTFVIIQFALTVQPE